MSRTNNNSIKSVNKTTDLKSIDFNQTGNANTDKYRAVIKILIIFYH